MSADRIHLRAATSEDATAIRSLIHRVQINPWGLDWHNFLVAVNENNTLVGCGQLKPHGRQIVELASIAVEQDYRGRGIARRIIDTLIAQAPRPLYLTCRSTLGPLYAKWGFQEVSMPDMPRYFQRLAGVTSVISKLARMNERLLVMVLK